MDYNIVNVTPTTAKKWLEKNYDRNRSLRSETVDKYARDMLAGNWVLTHQAIAFDVKGKLVDGQHRLHAVVKSGKTIRMLVVRNAPEGSYDHVDIGLGRTIRDVMMAEGQDWITNDVVAIARLLEFGFGLDKRRIQLSRSAFEMRLAAEKHKDAILFALSTKVKNKRNITIAPVFAALALAYYNEKDKDKLLAFMEVLREGIAMRPEDATVIHFRDWLRDNPAASSNQRKEAFMRAQRVIKAYIKGEILKKLYTPDYNIYQMPRHMREDTDNVEIFVDEHTHTKGGGAVSASAAAG